MLPICTRLKGPCALWDWTRGEKWLKKVHSCAIISSTAMERAVRSFCVWITSFSINPGLPILCRRSISYVSSPNFVLAEPKNKFAKWCSCSWWWMVLKGIETMGLFWPLVTGIKINHTTRFLITYWINKFTAEELTIHMQIQTLQTLD